MVIIAQIILQLMLKLKAVSLLIYASLLHITEIPFGSKYSVKRTK